MGSFFYSGKLSVAEGKEKKDEEKKIFGAFSVCGNGCRHRFADGVYADRAGGRDNQGSHF